MLAVAFAAAGFAVPLWAQEQLPLPDGPTNALRSTGTTYQQLNGGDGNNSNSTPVWNVSPVSRGGVGPSLGATQQQYGLQPNSANPNSANSQPFWSNQSGTNNPTPKYQYTPPEQPRPFGRLRKLFGGPATPNSTSTSVPAPASLPPATAMSPAASSNPGPTTNSNIGLPPAKPAKPQTQTNMVVNASLPAPAAVLIAPRALPVAARPDWGWNGYDNFNQMSPTNRQPPQIVQADNRSASAITNPDMGPYMKYAHLWRPSNGSAAITNPALAQRPAALPADDTGFSIAKENSPAAAGSDPGHIHALPPGSLDGPILNPEPEGSSHVQPAHYGPGAAEHRKSESVQPVDSLTVWPTSARSIETKPEGRPAPISTPPPPAPGGTSLPLPIRQKIGEICKDGARNLVVEQISPLHLRVGFVCKTQAEADAVTNHLASMPELRPYNLDYEIQIGQ
jgi:hypothetical protein